jgi:hypothetical protein
VLAAVGVSSLDSEFFPRNVDLHFMSDPPAPSAGTGVVEDRLCWASILTDSMTRYSLSALLTFPTRSSSGLA